MKNKSFSFLGNASLTSIEALYQEYLNNPEGVEDSWKRFFEGFEFARTTYHQSEESDEFIGREFKVINLINAYRSRGHLFTKTNPVRKRREYSPTLSHLNFGLSDDDLETAFKAGSLLGLGNAKLKDIISYLETTYCRSIGVEFMFIRSPLKLEWLQKRIEEDRNTPRFPKHIKRHILSKLSQAVGFEQFLHKRFTGQKRFSLEGAESLIPALDAIIEKGATIGIKEFVVGMPHRGRLNVLANIMNKSYQDIFTEFEGKEYVDNFALGDVKYHLGYAAEIPSRNGEIVKVSLTPNPSHLEAVNPIVEGITRAKIDNNFKGDEDKIAPILIHGDAAIAGQGIVYEVAQMSQLKGYRTGGTIHIVVNNQLGFTTDYLDARTSTYCTDIAKVLKSPVFHVNGDDPEALIHAIHIAMDYRQQYNEDVFIDLLCYRRHGHNESDEPRFTQPLLYKAIASHPDPRSIYVKQLIEEGIVTQEDVDKMMQQLENMLQDKLLEARKKGLSLIEPIFKKEWGHIRIAAEDDFDLSPSSGVSKEKLLMLAKAVNYLPADINFFNKTRRLFDRRQQMIDEGKELDWAMCEHLAYASLLDEGIPIRLSGQDVGRGTFSHRHAIVTIDDSCETYIPLNSMREGQALISIYNSPLNEYGVLGFDYGYAMNTPDSLIIWEAQFGDFANGAQIIIDQYISSAEDKWKVMNGLVMLLPHGYEGQGPEHSSARLERFLTLAANNNMQIVNCTTPANFFHLLRRQMIRDFRKPLVVFTPKSLLRHPACVSSLEELTNGAFAEIIDDVVVDKEQVEKVILCSGKLFYDLDEERNKRNLNHIALIRMEQLYPLPLKKLKAIREKYHHATEWVWAQEEPENMGAWPFISRKLKDMKLVVVARLESGSPAGGLSINHKIRQTKIINECLGEQ